MSLSLDNIDFGKGYDLQDNQIEDPTVVALSTHAFGKHEKITHKRFSTFDRLNDNPNFRESLRILHVDRDDSTLMTQPDAIRRYIENNAELIHQVCSAYPDAEFIVNGSSLGCRMLMESVSLVRGSTDRVVSDLLIGDSAVINVYDVWEGVFKTRIPSPHKSNIDEIVSMQDGKLGCIGGFAKIRLTVESEDIIPKPINQIGVIKELQACHPDLKYSDSGARSSINHGMCNKATQQRITTEVLEHFARKH